MNGRGFSNPDSSYSVTMSSGECARLLSKNEKVRFEPQINLLCTFNNLRALSFLFKGLDSRNSNEISNNYGLKTENICRFILPFSKARTSSSRGIMTRICRALLLQQVDNGVAIFVPSFIFKKFGKTREKLRLCRNVIARARIELHDKFLEFSRPFMVSKKAADRLGRWRTRTEFQSLNLFSKNVGQI